MRRNREINIFSMSALDLFASALGAFILLAIIALPYFGNLAKEKLKPIDNLIIIEMEWHDSADIDLHVVAPGGGIFKYNNRIIPGVPGKLTLDNTSGGANSLEVWKVYNPLPGEYQVCFHYYSGRRNPDPVRVQGGIDKPTGPVAFNSVTLTTVGQKKCIYRFSIDQEYTFTELPVI